MVSADAFSSWSAYGDAWKATNDTYTLIMWNSTGTHTSWLTTGNATTLRYLVVAGGAAGGDDGSNDGAGGGGAGGLLTGTATGLTGSQVVVVGAGGSGITGTLGNPGENSTFGIFEADGGGGGNYNAGAAGGSGGGTGPGASPGGTGTQNNVPAGIGFGANGGNGGSVNAGGGGGGAGGAGVNSANGVGGNGGICKSSDITGTYVNYSGGGGGSSTVGGTGGCGIGGAGSTGAANGGTGAVNTGSGGGAARGIRNVGDGGSGIVIIQFQTPILTPVATFTQDVTTGTAPATIELTDTTTNSPTAWSWGAKNLTPGNNTWFQFSTSQNTTSIFGYGNWSLNLTATNAYGTNISTQTSWFNVSFASPIASFTQNKTSGPTPLAVSFTDTSTNNPNVWVWAVNNTEIQNSSVVKDFTYTFYPVGTHQVNLTVWNTTLPVPPSMASQNITVNASIVANFTAAPTSGFATLDVAFVDISTPADIYSWSWEFGDGFTSTEKNATHSYTSAGLYTVNLTVTNPDGSKTESKVAYIDVSTSEDPNPDSTLQFKPDANIIGNQTRYNQTIQIKNVSIASYVNGSTTFDPSHLYATKVYANLSTYAGNTLVASNIDNTTGLVTWQVTNAGGYTAGATPVSIIDIEMFQKSYAMGDITQSPGSGNLGNATYNTSHAIVHSELANFTYAPWITYSNFTINNTHPVIFEDTVTFESILPSNITADRWLWDFGDGNSTLDTTGHPVTYKYVTFAANTTLYPKLTAYLAANASVTNTTTLTISPVYNTSFIAAAFAGSPTTGNAGLSVSFTDQSQFGASEIASPRSYNWSFGDGTYSDIKGSTSHVYTTLGTYTVALSVGNSYGNSTETKVNYIIISNSQQTTWYSPKQIGVTAVYRDPAGIRIPNAPMTMRAIASSIPATATTDTQQSLQLFYGINPTAANLMMNNTLLMSGITGGDGSASFTVLASINYQVNITDPKTGIVWSSEMSPSDPLGMYTVWVGNAPFAEASNTSINQLNQTKLYITQPDAGNVTFNLIYKDTSGLTTNLVFEIVAANNKTRVYGVDLGNPGTSIVLANYTLPNVIDNTYYFGYNATRSA
jgi:PKD repeat protein